MWNVTELFITVDQDGFRLTNLGVSIVLMDQYSCTFVSILIITVSTLKNCLIDLLLTHTVGLVPYSYKLIILMHMFYYSNSILLNTHMIAKD